MGVMDWVKRKLLERRERYKALEAHMDKTDSIMDRQQFGGNHPLDTLDEIAAYDREHGGAPVPWQWKGRNNKPLFTPDQVERGIPHMREEPPQSWLEELSKRRETQADKPKER